MLNHQRRTSVLVNLKHFNSHKIEARDLSLHSPPEATDYYKYPRPPLLLLTPQLNHFAHRIKAINAGGLRPGILYIALHPGSWTAATEKRISLLQLCKHPSLQPQSTTPQSITR